MKIDVTLKCRRLTLDSGDSRSVSCALGFRCPRFANLRAGRILANVRKPPISVLKFGHFISTLRSDLDADRDLDKSRDSPRYVRGSFVRDTGE